LPDHPYAYGALDPIISETTLRTQHLKHHAKYVYTANHLISEGDPKWTTLTPERIIESKQLRATSAALFKNVARSWNHAFYWKCMKQDGGGEP
ncbi:iron superoxide dismutase, partial [Thalassiosira pseudonana CCMP1335]